MNELAWQKVDIECVFQDGLPDIKNGIDICQSRKMLRSVSFILPTSQNRHSSSSLGQFYFTDESEPSLVIIKAKEQISLLSYILRDLR